MVYFSLHHSVCQGRRWMYLLDIPPPTKHLIRSTSPAIIALCISSPPRQAQPLSNPFFFFSTEKFLLVSFPVAAGRAWLPALVLSMLEGAEGDAPEHSVLRRLLQPELRDQMPEGHVLCSEASALLTRFNTLGNSQFCVFKCGDPTYWRRATLLLPRCRSVSGCQERWWHSLGTCRCPPGGCQLIEEVM